MINYNAAPAVMTDLLESRRADEMKQGKFKLLMAFLIGIFLIAAGVSVFFVVCKYVFGIKFSNLDNRSVSTGSVFLFFCVILPLYALTRRLWKRMCGTGEKVKKAAAEGDPAAQYLVGAQYLHGYGVSVDYREAERWLSLAANSCNSDAQNDLGVCLVRGSETEENSAKAFEWFEKAAENGFREALYNQGVLYLTGRGTDLNPENGAKCFEQAARLGHLPSLYNLGACYFHGKGVPLAKTEAVDWFRKAADQKYLPAMVAMAHCSQRGEGMKASKLESAKWRMKIANHPDSVNFTFGIDD